MQRSHHVLIAALFFLVAAVPARAEVPTAEAVFADAGYSADEIASVKTGSMVRKSVAGANKRDLAAGFAFLVKVSPAELLKDLKAGLLIEVDPNTITSGTMTEAGSLNDLATVALNPGGAKRVKRYLGATAGRDLNLSTAEITAFNKLGAAAAVPAVEAQVRSALLARYQAYRTKGLDGIAPYDRSKGSTRAVADELRTSLKAFETLQAYAPAAHAAMLEYPNSQLAGTEESFRWMHFNAHGVPTLALVHGMAIPEGDGFIVLQRQFYVSEGYNCEQAIAAILPVQGGSIVIYANHTSTDQVQGSMGGMKRSIGSKMLSSQLEGLFEKVQKQAK